MSSTEWLQANLGSFAEFATLQDLLALNANFSSVRCDCCCSSLFPKLTCLTAGFSILCLLVSK